MEGSSVFFLSLFIYIYIYIYIYKGMIFILNPNPIILNFYASLLFKMVLEICLPIKKKKKKGYQRLVWQEVLSSSYLSTIYSSFVVLKIHRGLYLVCLTLYVRVWGRM